MAFFPSGFAEAISTNRPLCDGRRVKPPAFAYRSVETVAALLELRRAAGEDAQILAGGQSLMPMINMRIARPAMLIDINPVMALRYVRPDAGFVEIGAMTRWRDLEDSAEIAALAPLVAQALPLIAHPAVRNRGTVGGSLALADPAAELPACVLALGGELLVASADQRRTVPAEGFFRGLYHTALAADEALLGLRLLAARPEEHFAIYEIARRYGDYALAGAAIAHTATGYRIAVFGVAERACLSSAAAALAAADPAASAGAFADALTADIDFVGDHEHPAAMRRQLAGVAVRRALDRIGTAP